MFQHWLTISRIAVVLMAAAMVAGSAGCGSQSSTPPPPPPKTLTSIQITPANPSVAAGSTQQFTAMGTFSDEKEEVELGRVLADAIGQGTGEAEAEYIQEHLDELGPLIPQEAMQKVQQYLKLTEQWAEKLKEIEKLNVQVEKDSFALADHGVAAKALEEKMGKCPSGC